MTRRPDRDTIRSFLCALCGLKVFGEQFGAGRHTERRFHPSAMKNADSFLSAMNKYFVFNNLCGIAAGTAIFPSTMCGDQKAPSPTKMCRIFRYLRRCGDAQWFFQKHGNMGMILSIKRLFPASLFSGFRKISSVLLPVLSW